MTCDMDPAWLVKQVTHSFYMAAVVGIISRLASGKNTRVQQLFKTYAITWTTMLQCVLCACWIVNLFHQPVHKHKSSKQSGGMGKVGCDS